MTERMLGADWGRRVQANELHQPNADNLTPEFQTDDMPLAEGEQRSPVYRMAMRIGLPVLTSLVLHAVLFVVLALTTWEVLSRAKRDTEYNASLTQTGGAGEFDSFQWSTQQLASSSDVRTQVSEPSLDATRLNKLEAGAASERASDALGFQAGLGRGADFGIGEGRSSVLGTGISGAAGGLGDRSLAGAGSGRGVGSAGMWGRTVMANRVVFVLDYSGSIIVAVDDLKRELKRSIGVLRPTQQFNVVIFYSDDDRYRTELFAPELQPATREVRERFFAWIDAKSPQGRTEPLAALRRAMKMEPEAIFFLTDGDFEDRVVEECRAINTANAKICCLVFDELLLQSSGPTPPALNANARRLRQIAEDSGGWMVIVTAKDLRRAM